MAADVEHFLNAQHCLTIAAAFIAIIAACATLISSANNKADGLTVRIREATKEYRKRRGDRPRCEQIEEQIELFETRFRAAQRAQRLLFLTMGVFIAAVTFFIGLGLYVIYFNIPDEAVYTIARIPVVTIGAFVSVGTASMLIAIWFQFSEVANRTRPCALRPAIATS